MHETKTINTPIVTSTKLDKDETRSQLNNIKYRGIIGSLLYLIASRLDIMFSVNVIHYISFIPQKTSSKGFQNYTLISQRNRAHGAMDP